MPKVPALRPEAIEKLLILHGFVFSRQKGSHKRFKHPDGRSTTVPFHGNRDVSPVLLKLICKEINLSVDEFLGKK